MKSPLSFLAAFAAALTLSAHAAGPYDFNGDAKPDLVMHNKASGAAFIWRMDGTTLASDQYLATVGSTWMLAGSGDFNGDGHTDVIWHDSATGAAHVWFLQSGTFVSDAPLFSFDPAWKIGAVADFDANGKPDLLMWNGDTGLAFVWYLNGTTPVRDHFLFQIDPVWKVEAVADYNADGLPDLLFRHALSGLAFAWYTSSSGGTTTLAGSSNPIFSIDPAWEVVQSADWNADGKPDLVFRNASSGVVFVWYLNGVQLAGSESITQVDTSWNVVPRTSSGSCAPVSNAQYMYPFGTEGSWQPDYLNSGRIGVAKLVNPLPDGLLGASVTLSQISETPSPITIEATFSKCPGDMEYWKQQPRSDNTYYPCRTFTSNPSGTTLNWHTTVGTHYAYCYAPPSQGTWYFNLRLVYPTCSFATANCGLSRQWNRP